MTKKAEIGFHERYKEGKYASKIGELVRINTQNDNYIGILAGVDGEFLYLCPVLVREDLTINSTGESVRARPRARIEDRFPTQIPLNFVGPIERLNKGYLRTLAQSINDSGAKLEARIKKRKNGTKIQKTK